MILIVSDVLHEAKLLGDLCDHRKWPSQSCLTINHFKTMSEQVVPRAVVVRQRLSDGYSDDIFSFLNKTPHEIRPRVLVLMAADASAKAEARQVSLGADCVLRDPVRLEVLMEYLGKYRMLINSPSLISPKTIVSYKMGEVEVLPMEHRIVRGDRSVHVAPQEIALLRILTRSQGRVVTYAALYDELLSRKFVGDTTNCRVLLGKVCASFKRLDVRLKEFVQVIPKSGYLYTPSPSKSAPLTPKRFQKAKAHPIKLRRVSTRGSRI